MDKKELRQWIRAQKRLRTPEQLAEESARICLRLLEHPAWRQARCVLLYHALPDEVDTRMLLSRALHEGKRVVLPVVCGDVLQLRPYEGQTATGAYGIEEPTGTGVFTAYDRIDLAVVPGMAFDASLHRLGRGKGYYDRLLPHLACPKIGICFSFQHVDSLPTEPHDIPMTAVLFHAAG